MKRLTIIYFSIALFLTVGFLGLWYFLLRHIAYTDDAYVQGNQVAITPLHSGFVTKILTDDTFLVEKGQVIVELDDTDDRIALEKEEKKLAEAVRRVCESFHQVFALRAEVESRKAIFIKAAEDFDHRAYVLDAGGVSLEDFQHAVAELRTAFFSLHMTEALLEKALSFVQGTSIFSHPSVLSVAQNVRQAWVNLHRCKIYAPVSGLVAQRSIQVGMWVPAGTALMAVIPLDQIWVNANFKETQMRKMRIGQPVRIRSDIYGNQAIFHGTIVGLPGGAGNAFSLLPPQNLSGNWIKIVQRLPVRVSIPLEELKAFPLRIGLSMEATVNLKHEGSLVPITTDSPNYTTAIFNTEESGDELQIIKILEKNFDKTLEQFKTNPL